jgi:hypothetical protein
MGSKYEVRWQTNELGSVTIGLGGKTEAKKIGALMHNRC